MVGPDGQFPVPTVDEHRESLVRLGLETEPFGDNAALIRSARPELTRAECSRRAADIDVLQNGLWLTALLGLDRASVRRCVARCEELALS